MRYVQTFTQFINEVHYKDIYTEAFEDFMKKYKKRTKGVDRTRLYVQFTNHQKDELDRSGYHTPNHHDPVGVYGYPLDYVVKYPGDVWYGREAKYLRVLEMTETNEKKILRLQDVQNKWDAQDMLQRMGLEDLGLARAWSRAESDYEDRWGTRRASAELKVARTFFQCVQMEYTTGKEDGYEWLEEPRLRSGQEQKDLLTKAGYTVVIDSAKSNNTAIINDREPEQIIFLTRYSFKVLDTFFLRPGKNQHDKKSVGTSPDYMSDDPRFGKLASKIAKVLGDSVENSKVSSGEKLFWTKGGYMISLSFERHQSYYEENEIGRKKHKYSKEGDTYLVYAEVYTEYGVLRSPYTEETFDEVANYILAQYDRLKKEGKKDPNFKEYSKKRHDDEVAEAIRKHREEEAKKRRAEEMEDVKMMNEKWEKFSKLLNLTYHKPTTDDDALDLLDAMKYYFAGYRQLQYGTKPEWNEEHWSTNKLLYKAPTVLQLLEQNKELIKAFVETYCQTLTRLEIFNFPNVFFWAEKEIEDDEKNQKQAA